MASAYVMRGNGASTFSSLDRVALEHLQLLAARLEHAADDERDEVLGEAHVAVEVHERDLRLDHPELGQVAARLALLGAERRPEAVDAPERRRGRLHVELPRLRQVRLVAVVVGLEEVARPLAGVRREDGRVDEREAAAVEEVADGLDDGVAHAHDRVLPLRAQPQVAVVHQEVGPVLLRADGVLLRRRGEEPHVLHVDLVLPLDLAVLLHGAGRLRPTTPAAMWSACWKSLRRDVALEDDALDDAGAVAHLEEVELAARPLVVEPALEGDRLADVLAQILDAHCAHGPSALYHLFARRARRRSSAAAWAARSAVRLEEQRGHRGRACAPRPSRRRRRGTRPWATARR